MKGSTSKANGFTLLEVMVAMVLLGLAVVSLVAASSAFTTVNSSGVDLSTAEFLIEEIREMTASMDFDTMEAYPDTTFSPPVDLAGTQMAEFSAFSQQITVQNVSATNLESMQSDGSTDFVRVQVTIQKNGGAVSTASWIRSDSD